MLTRFKNRYFIIFDVIFLALTPAVSLALRVNLPWANQYNLGLLVYTLFSIPVKILVFNVFGLYKRLWRYASVDAIISVIWGVSVAGILTIGISYLTIGFGLIKGLFLPRSIPIIDLMLTLIVVGGSRLSLRLVQHQSGVKPVLDGVRILIAGAGEAGQIIAREMRTSKYFKGTLVGFVDDDPIKIGTIIHNAPVLGSLNDIPRIVSSNNIDEVIIAMPSVPGEVIRHVVELGEQSGVHTRTLPGLYELISGQVTVKQLRDVEVGDLLRRKPVIFDLQRVTDLIQGKRVLVSGAGGSIGSELCSQISLCQPDKIIALDHSENNLFDLPKRITSWSSELMREKLFLLVADIRDRDRLDVIFDQYKPEIVFHTAAHKHVPLMEDNVEDAVSNNILGTLNLLELSDTTEVERFVNISTDKAVEPINVMGMTKKVNEIMVNQFAEKTGKPYLSVRFGNVLGSRGSVIPIFQEQIESGDPVTITHPDVERYFMTIQEAVQLVLQASAIGSNNEVFILEMGEPIKVQELAAELIQLSGLEVDQDIQITFTGLRPGEKITEKLFSEKEEIRNTELEMIQQVIKEDSANLAPFQEKLSELITAAREGRTIKAKEILKELAG
jgi:FlaA1/EpsC-like NDP-sugar epimerase